MQAPVPPGALPQEKADNVPAKLSQGEYVLPAEVVRWHGVKAIQDMMNAAQEGFGKLQQQGQIKGQQQMPPQSPNAGQGQPRPPMQQPPMQKPTMPTQRPPSPISGMADGGMVAGNTPAGVRLEQRTLPDGRMIYMYVDASGNPIGQMGSQFLGQNQAPQTESRVSDTVVPVSNNSITNPTNNTDNQNSNSPVRFEGSEGSGSPESDDSQGGPTNAADDPNASPMDAVGAMAAAIGRGIMGQVMGPIAAAEVKSGQFGAKMKGHAPPEVIETIESIFGGPTPAEPEHSFSNPTPAEPEHSFSNPTDGSPAGDGRGVPGGGDVGGPGPASSSGGQEGPGNAGSSDGPGSVGGPGSDGSDGAENFADGGMVCPPGLHMKAKSKPKGKSAPWLK